MYTTTFYSFKGGVGRTLALVNAGLEFAKRGHRVLLVDFDLEAPGIDTIKELAPKCDTNGLVDFISDYLSTGQVPTAIEYMYKAELPSDIPGEVWVMPAGLRNEHYATKLASIDWQELYAERDGFLLLDDLKRQWQEQLKPSYVLIDSRTGHTEVGGICTRQLPDAVVLLYLPNAQNLLGLSQMVWAIRAEGARPEGRKIELLFAISNVPDLDDEEEILRRLLADFARKLGYERPDAIIHRYDSLTLLNQAVFVLERPRSRLAREYRTLAAAIAERNLEDRSGVLRSLRRRMGSRLQRLEDSDIDRIQQSHANDSEVLYEVSRLLRRRGQMERERLLLERAGIAGKAGDPIYPNILVRLAELSAIRGEIGQIPDRMRQVLDVAGAELPVVLHAINLLNRHDSSAVGQLAGMNAVKTLSPIDRLSVSAELTGSRQGQTASVDILKGVISELPENVPARTAAKNSLCLCLIGLGRFQEALALFDGLIEDVSKLDVVEAFNAAMAHWGVAGSPHVALLEQVVRLDESSNSPGGGSNYHQCIALALCALGRNKEGKRRLQMALEQIKRQPDAEFSCWSYLRVPPSQFIKEIGEMDSSCAAQKVVPQFLRDRHMQLFDQKSERS